LRFRKFKKSRGSSFSEVGLLGRFFPVLLLYLSFYCLLLKATKKTMDDEFRAFLLQHQAQLSSSGVPEQFWYNVYSKLKNKVFDAGSYFMMARVEDEDDELTVVMTSSTGLDADDPTSIFLVDHAWTFEAKDAIAHLKSIPTLLERVSNIVGLVTEVGGDGAVQLVHDSMWKYLRTYARVVSPDDPPVTFWYMHDEFGSAIRHSPTPNCRMVPFFYQDESTAYSLLFPVRCIEYSEQVSIDLVEGVGFSDARAREALMVPWTGESFAHETDEQMEPDDEYFMSGAHTDDLPTLDQVEQVLKTEVKPQLRVFSEYPLINEFLTSPSFTIVDNENDADVLWLNRHFNQFRDLAINRPFTLINQFPCERVITTKDLLCIVARRAPHHKWLPPTYNLMTELPTFVGEFQRRELSGKDNHWIAKPWNLARALDTTVTNNLDHILRLPFSGPKIVQKYVDKPVLFNRPDIGKVKFDVRYVVLLDSLNPLKLYCHRKFYLRFANKPFELQNLWDYEKHFTVMNYRNDSLLFKMVCEDFVPEFEKQNPGILWKDVEQQIFSALREVFEAASSVGPPRGLAANPQSRALYAADLILAWDDNGKIQPQLLEINFGPDCDRACRYYPNFYNDIFSLLFRREENDDVFCKL